MLHLEKKRENPNLQKRLTFIFLLFYDYLKKMTTIH